MMTSTRRRVLIVDDDRQMVRTLCDVLRYAGWEPVGATSGEAAVAAVADAPFNAVLMDMRMEGMSGVDALRAIRATHPALPVLLMTAYSAQSLMAEASSAGAARILAKPVAPDQLTAVLDAALA